MSDRCFDFVVFAEIFSDFFGFGRGFHDNKVFDHRIYFYDRTCLEGRECQGKVKTFLEKIYFIFLFWVIFIDFLSRINTYKKIPYTRREEVI